MRAFVSPGILFGVVVLLLATDGTCVRVFWRVLGKEGVWKILGGLCLGAADELVALLSHLTVAGLGFGGLLEAARVFQQVANMVEAKNVELAHQLVIADKQSDLAHRVGTRNVAGLLQETTGLSG